MKTHIPVFATFLTILTLLGWTCKKSVLQLENAEVNTPFGIASGGKVFIDAEKIVISVSEISDSRCPADVQCVWAGNAKVDLALSQGEQSHKQLSFCIGQCKTRFQQMDTLQIENAGTAYDLILTAVKPYPATGQNKRSALFVLRKR